MEKSIRVSSKAAKAACLQAADIETAVQTICKRDYGAMADWVEMEVRDMLLVEGIQYSRDFHARHENRDDVRTRDADGNPVVIEVKTGAGAVACAVDTPYPADHVRTPEEAFPYADYVAYYVSAAELYGQDRDTIADEMLVFPRAAMVQAIVDYAHGPRKAGWLTSTHYTKDRMQVNLQTPYVKPLWDGLTALAWADKGMTLRTFCEEVLGRSPRPRP